MTRRGNLALAVLAAIACASGVASAQRVAIVLPRDSVFVGDTIKNVTATAYDLRNRRVPSAKFAWSSSSAAAVRVVANGNGTTASLIGVALTPGATIKATWRRSDGGSPSATVVARVVSRSPVPVRSMDPPMFIRFSVARRLGICGNISRDPAVQIPATGDSVIGEYVPKDTIDAWTAHCMAVAQSKGLAAPAAVKTPAKAPRSAVVIPVRKPPEH